MVNVLYIHGMGGGGDSRIPSILNDSLASQGVNVVVRTYDFDPETASRQIAAWVDETRPRLVIGESLGAVHAIRLAGLPHILISPALNAPLFFSRLSFLVLIPGVARLLDKLYEPKEGDRQKPHFTFNVLRKYSAHRKTAILNSCRNGGRDYFHAFFGIRDHYRRSGVVSVRTWRKYFGNTYSLYDGTHYTEEEYIYSMVIPKILEVLG